MNCLKHKTGNHNPETSEDYLEDLAYINSLNLSGQNDTGTISRESKFLDMLLQ